MSSSKKQASALDKANDASAREAGPSGSSPEQAHITEKIDKILAETNELFAEASSQLEASQGNNESLAQEVDALAAELHAKQKAKEEETEEKGKSRETDNEQQGDSQETKEKPKELSKEGKQAVEDLIDQFGEGGEEGYTRESLADTAKKVDKLLRDPD